MKTNTLPAMIGLAGTVLFASHASANTGAYVECWAPGMDAPVVLTSAGQSVSVNIGPAFRYKITGISGKLTLGTVVEDPSIYIHNNGKFRKGNSHVQSRTWVSFQADSASYPASISVSGEKPGSTSGQLNIAGPTWNLREGGDSRDVIITFSLPGPASGENINMNPTGHIHVQGEYQAESPLPTGTLVVGDAYVLQGSTTSIQWEIFRTGSAPAPGQSAPPAPGVGGGSNGTGGNGNGGGNNGGGNNGGGGNGSGNNGHGNNIDGVDVSNPGKGHGGPNGREDPSGEFDDEGGQGYNKKKKNK